jgi:hypothetical protein
VTEIKIRRLDWLGHVTRMGDTRIPEMIFSTKPDGRRGDGRPKLRLSHDVEAHIETLRIKRWRLKTQDRKEWAVILREAKARLKGP